MNQITQEIGVTAQDVTLTYRITIDVKAKTDYGTIRETFTPQIVIPLSEDTITIDGSLTTTQTDSLNELETSTIPADLTQRRMMPIVLAVFAIILLVVLAFTRATSELDSYAEKQLKKINKKYGEWIIETDKVPTTKNTQTIVVKAIEDLVKISEELGKPIMYHKTTSVNPGEKHTFYVFDENISYKHELPMNEIIQKTAQCPSCGNKIECEDYIGKTVRVICPNCFKKGTVKLEKTGFLRLFKKPSVKTK